MVRVAAEAAGNEFSCDCSQCQVLRVDLGDDSIGFLDGNP